MRPERAACVVLASGLSQRFGRVDKLKASLCGKPVLQYVLATAHSIGFGKIFVVAKHKKANDIYDIDVIKNSQPELGQGHSLRLGLQAVCDEGWDATCVLLGDMPLVRSDHIADLLSHATEKYSSISVKGQQKMPPAVFNKAAILNILKETSTSGVRTMFGRLDLITVPITESESQDVDTQKDLATVETLMRTPKP